jgi:aspartate aminotransferase-like enzyme
LAAKEKAILLSAGRWGERWKGILKAHAANTHIVSVPYGKAVTPEMLATALKEHPDAGAVFATLSETSTGVGHDIQAFGKLVAATPAVLVVDGISGLGAMECRTDEWNIDVVVSGSQKAFMLPPGLAYVSVSEKAKKKMDATSVRGFYFDLRRSLAKIAESDTPFTPANTLIKAQLVSLKRMKAEGMEALWARHAKVAAATRAAVQAMGLELFAERPNNALTVIHVPSGVDGSGTLKAMEKTHGYKLADGQDDMKGKIWRLSHMGYVDAFDVLGAIAALELTLSATGFKVTVGAGVAAFQKAMAG